MYNFVLNYDGAALKICQFITSKCVKHIRFKIKIPSPAKAVNFGSKRGRLLRYTCKILASFTKEAHKKAGASAPASNQFKKHEDLKGWGI